MGFPGVVCGVGGGETHELLFYAPDIFFGMHLCTEDTFVYLPHSLSTLLSESGEHINLAKQAVQRAPGTLLSLLRPPQYWDLRRTILHLAFYVGAGNKAP